MKPTGSLMDRLYQWLACADPPGSADVCFVLAGREVRKAFALDLFQQKKAPRLLMSVARFEIRRLTRLPLPASIDLLKLAAAVPPPKRHFFLLFEGSGCQAERIPVGRFGTLSEIKALAEWLRPRPGIRTICIVSSATHLRRIRFCCRALLPAHVRALFLAARLSSGDRDRKEGWVTNVEILTEFFKLVLYWMVLVLRGRGPRQA